MSECDYEFNLQEMLEELRNDESLDKDPEERRKIVQALEIVFIASVG